ncbi:APC family permease [Oscillospiraceae bacterium MB08-C2-2]|nr:APC family permease [Oscillospiraceae bacterium MB08-C2-2]
MQHKRIHLKDIFLGKALKNADLSHEKLNLAWGLPIMASDAVSSVAYAIEEILLVLVPVLGFAAVGYVDYVALPILLLLLILAFSYSQIIDSYPNGGGSYIVSAENIGKKASLLAASSLIIDYVMTVAVSLSSATAAFLVAFPQFMEYRVLVALLFLSVITLLNLRGISESSKVFGIPTYCFIIVMFLLIVTGLVRFFSGTLVPISYSHTLPQQQALTSGMLLLLLLKAFSSGCSALTGIEAVSNAVPSFKEPSTKVAKHVLYVLVGIILFIFGGSILLATRLEVVPAQGQTVISQMGEAIFGKGFLFYILQFATSLILLLAANTAYNGLPTLLALLAHDDYMPHQFAQRGSKLSFSNGIMFIFVVGGILLIVFKADTHHLIPLYSVGVFLSFTLAQLGMVFRWIKTKQPGWRHKFIINAIGTFMSLVGMAIVFLTKFADGAWMLAIAIPLLSLIMLYIQRHYSFVKQDVIIDAETAKKLYKPCTSADHLPCIVLASSFSKPVIKALNYANTMSANVTALHISVDSESTERFKQLWEQTGIEVPLEIVEAPYRDIIPPLEEYISQAEEKLANGPILSVVFIKFVENRFMDKILHNQTTYFIERKLRSYRRVASVIIPYHYKKPEKSVQQ